MKKEYIFIVVLVLFFVGAMAFKGVFVTSELQDIQQDVAELAELNARAYRDSIVQNNMAVVSSIFEANQRGKQNADLVIAELLKEIGSIITASEIKYKSNEIRQEEEQVAAGLSFFVFNLDLTTDYKHLFEFIRNIEKNDLLIDIVKLNLQRKGKQDYNERSGTVERENTATDPYAQRQEIKVEMKLQIVKFI